MVLLAVVGFIWVISKITGIILLLVLSIFFAYLVSPLVEFLKRERTIGGRKIAIPKIVSIALAYLIILAAIAVVVLVILPSLSTQFPEFADKAKANWKSLGDRTQELIKYSRRLPAPLVDAATEAVPRAINRVTEFVTELVTTTLAYIVI